MTYKAVLSVLEKNKGLSLTFSYVFIYFILEKHWVTLKILAEHLNITDGIEEKTDKCTQDSSWSQLT